MLWLHLIMMASLHLYKYSLIHDLDRFMPVTRMNPCVGTDEFVLPTYYKLIVGE